MLARKLTVMAGTEEIPWDVLMKRIPPANFLGGVPHTSFQHFTSQSAIRGKPLLELLDHFYARECELPCDRVFSLLFLSSQCSGIKVDYSLSRLDLAYQILMDHKDPLCLYDFAVVADTLKLWTLSATEIKTNEPFPYLELDVRASQVVKSTDNQDTHVVHLGCNPSSYMWELKFSKMTHNTTRTTVVSVGECHRHTFLTEFIPKIKLREKAYGGPSDGRSILYTIRIPFVVLGKFKGYLIRHGRRKWSHHNSDYCSAPMRIGYEKPVHHKSP